MNSGMNCIFQLPNLRRDMGHLVLHGKHRKHGAGNRAHSPWLSIGLFTAICCFLKHCDVWLEINTFPFTQYEHTIRETHVGVQNGKADPAVGPWATMRTMM